MRKFFYKTISFTFILLIINFLFLKLVEDEYYISYETFNGNGFTKFILGDSQTAALEKFPEKFGIYNFSSPSDSYYDMLIKLDFMISEKLDIDTIYISTACHSLSKYREILNNKDRSHYFSKPSEYNFYTTFKERFVRRYIVLLNPKIRTLVRSKLLAILGLHTSSKKKDWIESNLKERKKMIESRYNIQFSSSSVSQQLLINFRQIAERCLHNNIRLIGIELPIDEYYAQKLASHELCQVISKELDLYEISNIGLDSSTFSACENCFHDADHLNEKGAYFYTMKAFGHE